MMVSRLEFTDKFTAMARLCGFTVQRAVIDTYYESLKYQDESTLFKALELMPDNPPSKLSLKHIKAFISIVKNETRTSGSVSHWNGTECPECEEGLIFTKHHGYGSVWRCLACKSYDAPIIPYYTFQNVAYYEAKLKSHIEKRKEISHGHLPKQRNPV